MELGDALSLSTSNFVSVLEHVSARDLALATPCEEWSVAQLVWHVARASDMSVLLVEGGSRDDAIQVMRTPAAPEVIAECRRALAAQMVSLAGADLEQIAHHPIGDVTVRQLYDFRIMDLTVHAWDLARAIGADEHLPPDLVDHVYGFLTPLEPFIGEIGIFGAGPSGSLAQGASAQAKMLDLSGRRP